MATTTITAKQIADNINEHRDLYYGDEARGLDADRFSRVYFGSDYVTIERDGEVHNRRRGKARAQTAGESAVEIVERAIERLS